MKHWKHHSKRGLALFLVLMMCMSLFPTTAFAVEEDTTCPTCEGVGVVESTCPDCGGAGEVKNTEACPDCEAVCATCGGTKQVETTEACPDCVDAEGEEDVECATCGGSREVTATTACPDCCATCGGTHQVTTTAPCGKCGGTGTVESTCPTCGGSGKVTQETEEVPADVQDFLDAVAELPDASEVTPANAVAIGDDVNDVLDQYEALYDIDPAYWEREDVNEALETAYAVYEAVLAAEDIDDGETYSNPDVIHTLRIPKGYQFVFDFTPALGRYVSVSYNAQNWSLGGVSSANNDIASATGWFYNQVGSGNYYYKVGNVYMSDGGYTLHRVTVTAVETGTTYIDVIHNDSNGQGSGSTLLEALQERIYVTVYDPETEHVNSIPVGSNDDCLAYIYDGENQPVLPDYVVFEDGGTPKCIQGSDIVNVTPPAGLDSYEGIYDDEVGPNGCAIVGFNAEGKKAGTAYVKSVYGVYSSFTKAYESIHGVWKNYEFIMIDAFVDVWKINVTETQATTYKVIYRDSLTGKDQVFNDEEHNERKAGTPTPACDNLDNIRRWGANKGLTFMGWKLTSVTPNKDGVQPTIAAEDANTNKEIIYTAQWAPKAPTKEEANTALTEAGYKIKVNCTTTNRTHSLPDKEYDPQVGFISIPDSSTVTKGADGKYTFVVEILKNLVVVEFDKEQGVTPVEHVRPNGGVRITLTWDGTAKKWVYQGTDKLLNINTSCTPTTDLVIHKRFVGVNAIPDQFKITFSYDDGTGMGRYELTKHSYAAWGGSLDSDGLGITWVIKKFPVGQEIVLTEENATVNGKNPTIAARITDNIGTVSVNQTGKTVTVKVTTVAADAASAPVLDITNTYAPSSYKLIYDANGGKIRADSTDSATTMTHEMGYVPGGYTFTVKTAPEASTGFNPTRKGYKLLGWADSADATTVQYTAGAQIKVDETTPTKTIFAVWQPNKPTSDEVNKEVSGDPTGKTGAVDVYCQPGRHQVGHFSAQKDNGRITIGEVVSDGKGGYTCDVTFVAQKFCDAYNDLKSKPQDADENAGKHTLVSGQVNQTVTFQWDAENSKWVLPTGVTGPLKFYVKCPETTFNYRLEYDLNGSNEAFTARVYGPTKDTSHEFDLSSATPTRDGYIFVGWAASKNDADKGIVHYGKGGKVTVTSTDATKDVNGTTYHYKTVYAVWASTKDVSISVDKTIQKQITGTDGSTGWRDLNENEALRDGDVVRYKVVVKNTSKTLSLTDLTLFDDMDRKLTDVKNIKISQGWTATSQYYPAEGNLDPLLYFQIDGKLAVNDSYTVWYEATVQNADGNRVENTATAYAEAAPELAAILVQNTSGSGSAGAESDGQVDVTPGNPGTDRPVRPGGGVSGSGSTGSGTETNQPSLSVTKTATIGGQAVTDATVAKLGDVISYKVVVENTGNVTLKNVVVEDAKMPNGKKTIASLAPNAKDETTYTYTVTAADVTAGKVSNTATAKSGEVTTPVTKKVEVKTAGTPKLTVTKIRTDGQNWTTALTDTANTAVTAGDSLYYTITVKNEGTAEATDVKLTENAQNLDIVSVVEANGTALTAGTDSYSLGNIAAGGSVVLHVTATAVNNATTAVLAKNTASVTSTEITTPVRGESPTTTVNPKTYNVIADPVSKQTGLTDPKGTWPNAETGKESAPKTLTPDTDGRVTLPERNEITPPDGKALDKWVDQKGIEYQPGQTIDTDDLTADLTLTPIWADDTLVDPTKPDQNGDKPGDGILDKYQVTVNFTSRGGTAAFAGATTTVVTLYKDGAYATAEDGGKGHLVATQIPTASAKNPATHDDPAIWTAVKPTTETEITANVTFNVEFTEIIPTDWSKLTVSKTAKKDDAVVTEVKVGDTFTYEITVTNGTGKALTRVTVEDVLTDVNGAVTITYDDSSYNAETGIWTVGDLAAGATETLTLTATAVKAGTTSNVAAIDGATDPDGSHPGTNDKEESDPVSVEVKAKVFPTVTLKYVDEDNKELKSSSVTVDPVTGAYDAGTIPAEYTDATTGTHYAWIKTEGAAVSGKVTEGSTTPVEIIVTYGVDTKSDPAQDQDDNPANGDGIPDSWQYTVTYEAKGGTVTPASTVVTRLDEATGKPSATGTAKLADEHLPDAKHDENHTGDGSWTKDGTEADAPKAGDVISGNTAFVVTFDEKTAPKVIVTPVNGDDAGTWPNETDPEKVSAPKTLVDDDDDGFVTLPDENGINPPTGKELVGWTTDPSDPDATVEPGTPVTVPATGDDVTYVPVWRDIVLTIDNTDVSGQYNGTGYPVTPVVRKNDVPVAAGDGVTVTVIYNTTNGAAPVNVGSYTATIIAEKNGVRVEKTVNVTITPRPVTVRPNNASKYTGAADPALTATVSGTIGNDRVSYSLSRTPGETAGTYTITASGAVAQGNYTVTFLTGTLTIMNRTPVNPVNPGNGGGGGGGGRPGTSPTRPGNTTTIGDTDVPLAGDLQLNKTDHFAYIKGYQDGTVRPNNPITRAQVATIFYRLLDETSRVIYFQETNDFTDVTNDYWANKAISTLTNAGIITGFSDGTFRPNAYITRAQFAAIAARFDNVVPGLNNPFTDVAEDYWARDLIAFAADRGWITGNGGKFRPLENITRVEVMDFINNVLERHVDEQGLLENATKWSDVPVTDPNYYVVEEATNSHDYTRRTEGQLMENWTQLNPDPVWDE